MNRSLVLLIALSLPVVFLFQNCGSVGSTSPSSAVVEAAAADPVSKALQSEQCNSVSINQTLSFHTVMRSAAAPFNEVTGTVTERSFAYPGNAFYAHLASTDASRPRMKDAAGMVYRAYKGIWANYCTPIGAPNDDCRRVNNPTKGNYITPLVAIDFAENPQVPGTVTANYQIRPMFRSYRNADQCTYAQIAASLNHLQEADAYISQGDGLQKFVRHTNDRAELIALSTVRRFSPTSQGRILADICLIDVNPNGNSAGIVLDYEVWDRRSPTAALAYVKEIRKIVDLDKNKQFYFYTNSLQDIGTRVSNGITEENANDIMQIVDGFSPIIWSGATPGGYDLPPSPRRWSFADSLDANLSILSNGGTERLQLRKIIPTVSLYDLSPAEALDLHDRVKAKHFDGIKIWNNGVKVDQACDNPAADEVIRCLVTEAGSCAGTTPVNR